jgi:glutathione S-transferase kappa 1
MVDDIARNTEYFGTEAMQMCEGFPHSTVTAMRGLTVLSLEGRHAELESSARQCWIEYWSHQRDISDNSVLLEAFTRAGVADAARVLERASSPDVKAALKANTAACAAGGAFGAPTMFVRRAGGEDKAEMFFGSDRFPLVARLLSLPFYGPQPNQQENGRSTRPTTARL